jgi:hypothetical protein
MTEHTMTRRLRLAGVSTKALATTLAKECPQARALIQTDYLGHNPDQFGFYIRPVAASRTGASAAEINKAMLVLETMRKEHLLQGKNIMDYPMFEAVKDAQSRELGELTDLGRYPYGLGVRALRYSYNAGLVPAEAMPLDQVHLVYIPDFMAHDDMNYQEPIHFAQNVLSWMRLCANRQNCRFVFFGNKEPSRVAARWGSVFGAYVQEHFLDIPVAI